MKPPITWRFHLRDGSVIVGEYLGSQDGFMYVGTGEQVDRLVQENVSHYVPAGDGDA